MAAVRRIRSATVIEAVVALVIVLIISYIAFTIFFQVTSSEVSYKKLKAQSLLSVALQEMKEPIDNEYKLDDYLLRTQVIESLNAFAVRVRLSVFDEAGTLIASRDHIVLVDEDAR